MGIPWTTREFPSLVATNGTKNGASWMPTDGGTTPATPGPRLLTRAMGAPKDHAPAMTVSSDSLTSSSQLLPHAGFALEPLELRLVALECLVGAAAAEERQQFPMARIF